MTTTNGTYAHNGGGRNMPDPQHDDWQQVEKDALTVGWLFWAMQLMLESWGAIFSVLVLTGLAASSDWHITTLAVSLYFLVGIVLNKRNLYQPVLPVSPPTRGRRLLQLLGWPLRQAVREMQQYILTTMDTASGQQLDGADIRFSLFLITVKWLTVWMLVTVFFQVTVTSILERAGS